MSKFKNFSIIGSGSWGTAIACHLARIYDDVKIYSRSEETKNEINEHQINSKYLGSIPIPSNIIATNNINDICNSEVIFIVVPSAAFTHILMQLKQCNISSNTVFIIATKGISSNPVQLFSECFQTSFTNPFAFFSGPNFAKEVACQKFATATISSNNMDLANNLAQSLTTPYFEITTTNDIITIQIAALVKNIIAIKSGMLEASDAGENARAWLITKGLKEISYISEIMGGKHETLIEPAVVGDLILTSYSKTSRNMKFGFELHKNNYSKDFIASYPTLVEGVEASKSIKLLIAKHNINMSNLPIINSVINALQI